MLKSKCGLFIWLCLAIPVANFAQTNSAPTKSIEVFRTGGLKFIEGADTMKLKNGDKVPGFTFADVTGKSVRISDLKGKYVVLDIWASWCTWCIKEYPYLQKIKSDLKDNNIVFISLSCDSNVPNWRNAIKMYKMTDAEHWIITDHAFMKAFAVERIPRFILLDKEGNVCNMEINKPSNAETEPYLKSLKGI